MLFPRHFFYQACFFVSPTFDADIHDANDPTFALEVFIFSTRGNTKEDIDCLTLVHTGQTLPGTTILFEQ
jgi:hypothetical protein